MGLSTFAKYFCLIKKKKAFYTKEAFKNSYPTYINNNNMKIQIYVYMNLFSVSYDILNSFNIINYSLTFHFFIASFFLTSNLSVKLNLVQSNRMNFRFVPGPKLKTQELIWINFWYRGLKPNSIQRKVYTNKSVSLRKY